MANAMLPMLNKWLKQATEELNFSFDLDQNRQCGFQIGDDLMCILQFSDDYKSLICYSTLVNLAEKKGNESKLKDKALRLNLFQEKTSSGAIGLTEDEQWIIYSLQADISEFDDSRFLGLLATFMETSSDLHKALKA
jgi:hypothetical protein